MVSKTKVFQKECFVPFISFALVWELSWKLTESFLKVAVWHVRKKPIEEGAKELRLNEAGVVIFKTDKPIVTEKFSFIEELGRFVIERGYNLQGAGIVTNCHEFLQWD